MRIAVLGLGYVGCVTGACLAKMGHRIGGVDISPLKVRMLNEGRSPVVEKGMERLVSEMVRRGRLRASLDPVEVVNKSDISLITVGTPSRRDGSADLDHVRCVAGDVGRSLRNLRRFHTVVVRSTVPPGTTESVVIPALERSAGKKAGRDFGVCFHPEFLREGSSIHDFFHPPKIVIGSDGPRSAKRLVELCHPIKGPLIITSLKVAEMVKYVDNAFHALKISFANEVGALSKSLGIDSHEVMRIFVQDKKLNISPLYLKPGFAFGGPCLPKDLRALCAVGRAKRLETPLLSSILKSNTRHLRRAVELILATGKRKIGVLGLAFKSGTDDLRESPACALVKSLLQAGKDVSIYEPGLQVTRLLGANRDFVMKEFPELPRLLADSPHRILSRSEVIVVAGNHPAFEHALRGLKRTQVLIDLVRFLFSARISRGRYEGLCW